MDKTHMYTAVGHKQPPPKPDNLRLLVCSPSNGNCDELAKRIMALNALKGGQLCSSCRHELQVVRIGRPDSIHQDCEPIMFDAQWRRKINELVIVKQCEKSSSLMGQYRTYSNERIKRVRTIKETNDESEVSFEAKDEVFLSDIICQ